MHNKHKILLNNQTQKPWFWANRCWVFGLREPGFSSWLSMSLSISGGATPGRARSNDLAGRSTALAQSLDPPCLLLCFGNSVNRRSKCCHIWPLYVFYFDGETALVACVLRPTTKKGCQLFWRIKCKSASRWPGWRIFWPRNDLAPLLHWRRHCYQWHLHVWHTELQHDTDCQWLLNDDTCTHSEHTHFGTEVPEIQEIYIFWICTHYKSFITKQYVSRVRTIHWTLLETVPSFSLSSNSFNSQIVSQSGP